MQLTAVLVNIVVVLGSTPLHAELGRRFASERTSLGEPIQVVGLDQSDGVVERDESFAEHVREQIIKEYFFGDAKRTLSPQIQQVDFDSLIIYKVADGTSAPLSTLPGNSFPFCLWGRRRSGRANEAQILRRRTGRICSCGKSRRR